MAVDIYRANVVLGLHMDSTFNDICGHTMAVNGTAVISSAQSKFGGASGLFGSSTANNVSAAASLNWVLGGGAACTLEFFAYPTAYNASYAYVMGADGGTNGYNSSTGIHWQVLLDSSAFYLKFWNGTASSQILLGSVTLNTWTHFAATYDGTYFRGFKNGVQVSILTVTTSPAPTTTPTLAIGNYPSGAVGATNAYSGYLDDIRITKGVARYVENFAVPTATFGNELPSPVILLTAPTPALKMYGGGFASFAPPTPTLSIYVAGGGLAISAPMQTIYSTGHSSYGENELTFAPPTPLLVSYGGSNAELTAPTPTLSSTATVVALANVTIDAPTGRISSTATVSEMVGIAVASPMARLIGYSGAVCSITLTGAPTIQATGTMGGVAQIAITAPLFQLESTATAQNHGSLLITAPMGQMVTGAQAYLIAPMATLTAIGTATVTATYEAYALNLNHAPGRPGETVVDEMTRYTNFPFAQVVRYKNSYYGVSSGALYLLEGTTDNSTPVAYAVETAKTDFGTPDKKTLISTYFGGRIGAAETVKLIVGETGSQSYNYTTPRGPLAQNYRQKFGRGIKTRYYALGVEGSDVFELDALDFEINKLTRRI